MAILSKREPPDPHTPGPSLTQESGEADQVPAPPALAFSPSPPEGGGGDGGGGVQRRVTRYGRNAGFFISGRTLPAGSSSASPAQELHASTARPLASRAGMPGWRT